MGKGKGGRIGVVAQVSSGVMLLATTCLRLGLLQKLLAKLRVRCNFSVVLAGGDAPLGVAGAQPAWVRFQCLHLNYISARLADLREQLLVLRRPVL